MNIKRTYGNPWLAGVIVAAVMTLITISPPAHADDLRFALIGDQEVPPVKTTASGEALIRINPDMSISGQVTTTGLDATMAHIHLGAAGSNGPVQINLARNGDKGWMVPEGARLNESQYKAYQSGELYINVHSTGHKGGELRGQLKP
ncbi:MAG: CHRD domain-containing protein [Rhodocyclaceae bacterium]|nr:CHRD domain-containing protein [Rhodocyclaceae bacterium]